MYKLLYILTSATLQRADSVTEQFTCHQPAQGSSVYSCKNHDFEPDNNFYGDMHTRKQDAGIDQLPVRLSLDSRPAWNRG